MLMIIADEPFRPLVRHTPEERDREIFRGFAYLKANTTNCIPIAHRRQWLEIEQISKNIEMGDHSKESLAEVDKEGNM